VVNRSQHVVPTPKGWSVRRYGANRATRVFDRQEDAVAFARELAKKEGTELYLHRRDGTVGQTESYGYSPIAHHAKR
jgi:hypothetical protein